MRSRLVQAVFGYFRPLGYGFERQNDKLLQLDGLWCVVFQNFAATIGHEAKMRMEVSFRNKRKSYTTEVRSLGFCLSAFVLALGLSQSCFAQPPEIPASASEIAGGKSDVSSRILLTIRQLSSNSFAAREKATEELDALLRQLSLAELSRLESQGNDLEGQLRLQAVVLKIKEELLQDKIKSFYRAKDPMETFGFDGWKTFSKYSGTKRNAKKLFLLLLEDYPELVEKPLQSKEEALDKAKWVLTGIATKRGELIPSKETDGLAALYCVNACEELYEPRIERVCIGTFQTAPFSTFSQLSEFRKTIDPMLEQWASRVEKELFNCLIMFLGRESPGSRQIAKRLLNTKEPNEDPQAFVIAMQALFRHGTREDVPELLRWLDDERVCADYAVNSFQLGRGFNPMLPGAPQRLPEGFQGQPFQPGGPNQVPNAPQFQGRRNEMQGGLETLTVEYRDIALLVAMHLSGEEVEEWFPMIRTHNLRGFVETSIGLPQDEKLYRKERIEIWRAKYDQSKQEKL